MTSEEPCSPQEVEIRAHNGTKGELTIEELQEILNEEHQETQRNVSPSEHEEDKRGPMPTSAIKDLLKKWEAVRAMVLEWHPNQADVSRQLSGCEREFAASSIPNHLLVLALKTRRTERLMHVKFIQAHPHDNKILKLEEVGKQFRCHPPLCPYKVRCQ
ncbi:uncharacterized protein TNCV_4829601 [Trichonephila clavipes]|nr:uncharacterized protein TNCV_4829601 [Trichonephila clavipes]